MAKKENKLSVCCACDDNYAPYLGTMLYSLLENNSWLKTVYLFQSSISESNIEKIKSLFSGRHTRLKIINVDEKLLRDFPTPGHFSSAIYIRLFIPSILKDEDYLLWLDSDIIIDSDMSGICNFLPEHKIISGVKTHNIFNSGVIIINIKRYNREKILDKLVYYIMKNSDAIVYPDQDALNEVIANKDWISIAPTYNFEEQSMVKGKIKHPKVIHYTGRIKPWMVGCNHPMKNKYFQYLKHTPWSGKSLVGDSLRMRLRENIPFRLWWIIRKIKAFFRRGLNETVRS